MENNLLSRIQLEVDAYKSLGLSSANLEKQTTKWGERVKKEPGRFIRNGSIDAESLANFRRRNIFLEDWPQFEFSKLGPRKYLGYYRAYKQWLTDSLQVLQEFKYDSLLKKYPCHPAGNPFTFQYSGYSYTYRWLKHTYYLGLMKEKLGNLLGDNFVALDLGSGYGIFSSLVKREFPRSHHILVDFPEQLLLAHYFLGTCFPEAKVAGIKEIQDQAEISRAFAEQYDFVLIPVTLYQKLGKGVTDLYTNFVSLGEMRREWFDYYLKSSTFLTSKYFYTVNRVISRPSYDTDITILDYVEHKPKKLLHFALNPIPSSMAIVRHFFFREKVTSPPIFEYICET